jgi:putative acetyltransferase
MVHGAGVRSAGVIEMCEELQLREGVSAVGPDDFARVVAVWEASVRATHTFVTEADIEVIRPLVRAGLPHVPHVLCVRERAGQVAGFIGVEDGKVEMLFVHPAWRGQGIGRRLLSYAVTTLGARELDVNEQNPRALGFYLRMGFEVVGRSAVDNIGKPYPLLHMRIRRALSPG